MNKSSSKIEAKRGRPKTARLNIDSIKLPAVPLNAFSFNLSLNPNQTCSVSNSSGALSGNDVDDVLVTCVAKPDFMFADGFESDF